jgi:hypothetical protein
MKKTNVIQDMMRFLYCEQKLGAVVNCLWDCWKCFLRVTVRYKSHETHPTLTQSPSWKVFFQSEEGLDSPCREEEKVLQRRKRTEIRRNSRKPNKIKMIKLVKLEKRKYSLFNDHAYDSNNLMRIFYYNVKIGSRLRRRLKKDAKSPT